jgi:hypothetical protein
VAFRLVVAFRADFFFATGFARGAADVLFLAADFTFAATFFTVAAPRFAGCLPADFPAAPPTSAPTAAPRGPSKEPTAAPAATPLTVATSESDFFAVFFVSVSFFIMIKLAIGLH